jgi:ABC-2 type transport system permease protein
VLLLVIFGELPAFHQAQSLLGGLTLFDLYVPILVAFSVAMLALLGLPMPLVSYRELGVLRRLSTSPCTAAADPPQTEVIARAPAG